MKIKSFNKIYSLAILTGFLVGLFGAGFHYILDTLDAGRILLKHALQDGHLSGLVIIIDSGDGDISAIDTDSWNLRYEF